MRFNGATFNKAQQDQLKNKVGAELDDVIKKVDEVDSRMLNYTGDWVTGNEYHENDVVTWKDGNLYEVIKSHTSSSTINPSKAQYYKAMTANRYYGKTYSLQTEKNNLVSDVQRAIGLDRRAFCYVSAISGYMIRLEFNEIKSSSFTGVIATGIHRNESDFFPSILLYYITTEVVDLSETILSTTGAHTSTLSAGSSITIYYEA